jgi:hypothetical protein
MKSMWSESNVTLAFVDNSRFSFLVGSFPYPGGIQEEQFHTLDSVMIDMLSDRMPT